MENLPFYKDRLFITVALIFILMLGLTVASNTSTTQTDRQTFETQLQTVQAMQDYQRVLHFQYHQYDDVINHLDQYQMLNDQSAMRRSMQGINRSLNTIYTQRQREPLINTSYPRATPDYRYKYDYGY